MSKLAHSSDMALPVPPEGPYDPPHDPPEIEYHEDWSNILAIHCPRCYCAWHRMYSPLTIPFAEWIRECKGCGYRYSVKKSIRMQQIGTGENDHFVFASMDHTDIGWLERQLPQDVTLDCTDEGEPRVSVGTREDGPAFRLGIGRDLLSAIRAARRYVPIPKAAP